MLNQSKKDKAFKKLTELQIVKIKLPKFSGQEIINMPKIVINWMANALKIIFPLSLKLIVIAILVASINLLGAKSVNAENQIVAEPAQITVSGVRGSVATRNIVLQTAEPIDDLELIPLDLNRSDGDIVFPAQAISVDKPSVNSTKQNLMMTLVKFDLKEVVRSGEFNGKLLLTYPGGEQIIPVTVKVKDHWFFPLIILLIGSALGVSVSLYRTQGRPRDEILVRVSQVRTQMQDDADFLRFKAFETRVEGLLVDVKMALQAERWEEAKNAIQQAELVESKWLKGRIDWLAQLTYYEEMKQRLQEMDRNIHFVQIIDRQLEDALREAPDLESPLKLRDNLQEIAEKINFYIPLQAKIKQLYSLSAQLSVEQAKDWQPKIQNLEQRMENLQPADLSDDAKFKDDVEAAIAELTQLVSQQVQKEDSAEVDFSINVTGGSAKQLPIWSLKANLLRPAPSTRAWNWEDRVSDANVRLKMFTIFSYATAIVFLAGAGFNQLYVDKATFGANPWKDYSALMAWGFGAEATRDAVTRVLQRTGGSGFNQETDKK